MAGSPSSLRAKTYSPSSLRTRSLSPALMLSSSALRAVKAYKAIKREDFGMKETELGSECSETESEPKYPSEQLSGPERGHSLFQKDVKKVKRLRTNCSIPGGGRGARPPPLSFSYVLREAGGRGALGFIPPAPGPARAGSSPPSSRAACASGRPAPPSSYF